MNDLNISKKFKKELWKVFFITVLIFFQYPIFIIIIYSEKVLKPFFLIHDGLIKDNDYSSFMPIDLYQEFELYGISWISISFIIFALIFLFFFVYKYKEDDSKLYQSTSMFSVLIIVILSTILFTSTEIKYNLIMGWCNNIKDNYDTYLKNLDTSGAPALPNELKPYFDEINTITKNNDLMQWIPFRDILWISGIEVCLVTIIFVNFQLKIYSNSIIDRKTIFDIEQNHAKNVFGETKQKRFLANILKPTPRNIAILVAIAAFIVSLPTMVYLFKLTVLNTSLYKIIYYTYIFPNYSQISFELWGTGGYYDVMNNVISKNQMIFVLYLPLEFFILTLSFIMILISFIINEKIISINFLQIIILSLWILNFLTSTFVLISNIEMNHLIDEWNSTMNNEEYEKFYFWVKDYFSLDGNNIKSNLFDINESISLYVITFGFFTVASTIGISQIRKAKNRNVSESLNLTS